MATKKRATGKTNTRAVAAGAAALAAAAAAGAAGYYFYGTKNAKKHRQAASVWAKGLKRDVEKGVKSLKKVDAKTVARVVDDAAAAYQGVRGVAAGDVRSAVRELKKNWVQIKKEMEPAPAMKRAVKKVTKAARPAPKKAVKKKTKKTR